jgi:hypothetical protein
MKKFLASFASLSKLKKFFAYGDRIRPTRDWYVILTIAGVLLLVGIGWNAFLFNELESGKNIGPTVTAPQKVIGNSVTSVQTVFQKRATEENNYQSTYHFVDPSLPGS